MSVAYYVRCTKARARVLAITTSLLLILAYTLYHTDWATDAKRYLTLPDASATHDGPLPLPSAYATTQLDADPESECAGLYDSPYLRGFSDSATSYCDNTSSASLTCFSYNALKGRTDSFCVGGPASVNAREGSVHLNCKLRDLSGEQTAGRHPSLDRFTSYWYDTGPRAVFNKFVRLDEEEKPVDVAKVENRNLLLVKRENTVPNIWHTFMQLMSVMLTLDVLRITKDPQTNSAFFSDREVENTQVLILDEYDDGPFFEQWSVFAGMPTVRFDHMDNLNDARIIVPLPGGSNPIWNGDWVDSPCNSSALLTAFQRRILSYYAIPDPKASGQSLKLTFIDRTTKRRLIDQDKHRAALQREFPDVSIDFVDFAALAFAEQIRTVRSTDLLVGVHGAGLTHEMFLPEGSTVVEILPPTVDYRGFKNMAKFFGHHYFHGQAIDHDYDGKSGDWHDDDVFIEEASLLELVGGAIAWVKSERVSH